MQESLMSRNFHVTRIVVDSRANALLLDVSPPLPEPGRQVATIDIGSNGRLIGIDLGNTWLEIAGSGEQDDHHLRSATIPVVVSDDRRTVRVPRRGENHEISFPSGNQCWRLDDGRTICAETSGL
jgi:hypothetical protein